MYLVIPDSRWAALSEPLELAIDSFFSHLYAHSVSLYCRGCVSGFTTCLLFFPPPLRASMKANPNFMFCSFYEAKDCNLHKLKRYLYHAGCGFADNGACGLGLDASERCIEGYLCAEERRLYLRTTIHIQWGKSY